MAIENSKLKKFTDLLNELFQLHQPELDFGIYRIMHARKDDINRFIEKDLPNIVSEAFGSFSSQDKVLLEQELEKAKQAASAAGFEPSQSPRVQEIEAQLSQSIDTGREEGEVYDALLTFFSRYYDEGDFVSRRVYKEGTYAIPYSGEEVTLHWANKDQYYIKSSESLRDFCFRLKSDQPENPMRVHFKVVDAEAGPQNNNKEADDAKRVFILDKETPWEVKDEELHVYFQYRPSTLEDWTESAKEIATAAAKKKPPTMEHLRLIAETALLDLNSGVPKEWRELLEAKYRKTDGELADYSVLMSQLNLFTKKNTFDYFIHKNLGEFLTRELDFYIKNELFRWEDISNMKSNLARLAPVLSKIEVIRTVGEKIIAFLAQLENFQKKLWLKKKFVTETNYCFTLDRLEDHSDLLAEIVANESQLQQWSDNVALDLDQFKQDIQADDWLKQERHRHLMVDTGLFDTEFKATILSEIDGLDEQCDGLLINSDNFQALQLIRQKYTDTVKCTYIDPPYNTSEDGFIYKNEYKHSSWMTMVNDRVSVSQELLNAEGVLCCAIDDLEVSVLQQTLDGVFGAENRLGNLVVEIKPSGRTNDKFLATSHEYILLYAKQYENASIDFFPLSAEQLAQYSEGHGDEAFKWRDFLRTGGFSTPEERPNSYYPIYYNPDNGEAKLERFEGAIEILPLDSQGKKRVWRKTIPSFVEHLKNGEIQFKRNRDGKWKVQIIDKVKTGTRPKSVWVSSKYDASSHGTKLLKSMFGDTSPFSFPKSIHAVMDTLHMNTSSDRDAIVLDYFAGSGTTGHAVINLNRADQGHRKYILVEMGSYFDSVVKPRIQKAVYSENWRDGRTVNDDNGKLNGISHCFKYIRLESYEDTLANLQLKRAPAQDDLLSSTNNTDQSAREAYLLNYMLDVETQGSASLLDVSKFVDPSSYQLKVRNPLGDETKLITVDLLETFNWLLGLTVEHIGAPIHFSADIQPSEYGRLEATVKRQADGQWWFRTVTGTNRKGQKVLVVWRNLPSVIAGDENGLVKDNAVLDAVLIDKLSIKMTESQDDEFDILYVNGDHNITIPKNRKGEMMEARVKLIEEDFHRLMFSDVEQ
jgi:adenine-specific DNA-methyltransferase